MSIWLWKWKISELILFWGITLKSKIPSHSLKLCPSFIVSFLPNYVLKIFGRKWSEGYYTVRNFLIYSWLNVVRIVETRKLKLDEDNQKGLKNCVPICTVTRDVLNWNIFHSYHLPAGKLIKFIVKGWVPKLGKRHTWQVQNPSIKHAHFLRENALHFWIYIFLKHFFSIFCMLLTLMLVYYRYKPSVANLTILYILHCIK
jgi:hypothetical protein